MNQDKLCNKCNSLKPIKQFSRHNTSKDGFQYCCKQCDSLRNKKQYIQNFEANKQRRKDYYRNNKEKLKEYNRERYKKHSEIGVNSRFKREYKISLEDYNNLLFKQKNSCGICLIDKNNYKQRFSVDHNHKTGNVRGLLCIKCNSGLGMFQENLTLFNNAMEYLKNEKN